MDQSPGIPETSAFTEALGVVGFKQPRQRELARFKPESRGAVSLLHVSGEVDISNSQALDAAITRASLANEGAVLVSFVACRFADCSCLGVLLRQSKLLLNRLLIVAPVGSGLRQILEVTLLTRSLPVYGSLRQAHLAIASDLCGSLGELSTWKSLEAVYERFQDGAIISKRLSALPPEAAC
jgi:anti-anti-sigma factor